MNGASGGVKNCSADWAGNIEQKERARAKKEIEEREEDIDKLRFRKELDLNMSNLEADFIVKTSRI
jgi:hypothetical protein